ncbi:MAG: 3D domain-containing protein [Bacteriovorax sp.]|nr:3D domain-containing protein [Bacteriovorax sp.]
MKKNKHLFAYSFVLILGLCFQRSSNSQDNLNITKFNFSKATITDLGEPMTLWATTYYLPEFVDGSGEVALRDNSGNELGPKLTLQEWCRSALEGSVRIVFKTAEFKTYNFDSNSGLFSNDCSEFSTLNIGNTKFRIANGTFGDGDGKYKLVPYRTIATDPLSIPTGTVLYIPKAQGAKILLKNGQTIIHDGYFFAGDLGGLIKLKHIDVFLGTDNDSSFFPWISHTSTLTFEAYIVKDQKIIDDLTQMHL